MKLYFVMLIIFVFLLSNIKAQNAVNQDSFAVEIDPIAYLLNGFSAHGIYQYKKIRFDAGFYGVQHPDFYSTDKDYKIKNIGVGLKVNYFINNSETWFAGVGAGWSQNNIEYKESKEKHYQYQIGVGIHTGAKFYLFRTKLYLSPWISIDYNLPLNKVMFDNKEFETKSISLFPTIHLGYKF